MLQKMDRERSGMGDVNVGRPTVNGLEKYKVDELKIPKSVKLKKKPYTKNHVPSASPSSMRMAML